MARRTRKGESLESTLGLEEIEGDQDQDGAETARNEIESAPSSSTFSVVDHSADDDAPLASTIEIVEPTPKRGRPKGTSSTRVPKATSNEIAQAAPLLVGLSNQVVVTWMGPECAMLQTEAAFLTPSIVRILSRLPRGAAQQVSLYTDPFIVLTALGLWAARISRVKAEQARDKYQVKPFEAARAYGESGTEFRPDSAPPEPSTFRSEGGSEESSNGQAKASADAIFRTVSPT